MDLFSISESVWALHQNQYHSARVQRLQPLTVTLEQLALTLQTALVFKKGPEREHQDLMQLDLMNQPQIVALIKRRFLNRKIYTSLGETLIAVNPYCPLPQLYSRQIMQLCLAKDTTHIFGVAERAYKKMHQEDKLQAIIITGESGAGKTQNTKLALRHLVEMHSKGTSLQQKILACNPILQAFGNAKTIRNQNSSRFGKYLKLQYKQGSIVRAGFVVYLLETARVTHKSQAERNFHIMYGLAGKSAQDFRYLRHAGSASVEDRQLFREVRESMKIIGLKEKQIQRVFQILRTVISLGQIDISQREGQAFLQTKTLNQVAALLRSDASLLHRSITTKVRLIEKQVIETTLTKADAQSNLSLLSRQLYKRVFDELVSAMNRSLRGQTEGSHKLGLLDIFGFQNFPKNSFQQLNINFANQKIQQLYTDLAISQELQFLAEDGVTVHISDPPDNSSLLQALQGPKGVYRLLDDICSIGSARDEALLGAVKRLIKTGEVVVSKMGQSLLVKHTQQTVEYSVQGFKEKNMQLISADLQLILNRALSIQAKGFKETLGSGFVRQVNELTKQLRASGINFIRCIKPNLSKQSGEWQQKEVIRQVRYLGILQTIRIRNSVLPYRLTYEDFYKRFALFCRNPSQSFREFTLNLVKEIGIAHDQVLLGNKRVYFSGQSNSKLNVLLQRFEKVRRASLLKLQRYFRICLFRLRTRKGIKRLNCILQNTLKRLQSRRKSLVQKAWLLWKTKKNRRLPEILSLLCKTVSKVVKRQGLLRIRRTSLHVLKDSSNNYITRLNIKPSKDLYQSNYFPQDLQTLRIHSQDLLSGMIRLTPSVSTHNKKLTDILQAKLSSQPKDPLAMSKDCQFSIDSLPQRRISEVEETSFFKYFQMKLRKQRGIFLSKSAQEILVYKGKPLIVSLTLLQNQAENAKAIQLSRLLSILLRTNQPAEIVSLVNQILLLGKTTSPQFKEQLIAQVFSLLNGNSQEQSVIRMEQIIIALLHVYKPSRQCLLACLNLILLRLVSTTKSQRQRSYLNVITNRINTYLSRQAVISYLPSASQLKALMCKRMIAVHVFFATGNKVSIYMEPYQNYIDLKGKLFNQVGIDGSRLSPQLFSVFQIINYVGKPLQETPLNQFQLVWDTIACWEKIKQKNKSQGERQPSFVLMVKIIFPFTVSPEDHQAVDLCFAQGYFEHEVGKLELTRSQAVEAACWIRQVNAKYNLKLNEFPTHMKPLQESQIVSVRLEKDVDPKFQCLRVFAQSPAFLRHILPVKIRGCTSKAFLDTHTLMLQGKHRINIRQIQRWKVISRGELRMMTQDQQWVIEGDFVQELNDYIAKVGSLLAKRVA